MNRGIAILVVFCLLRLAFSLCLAPFSCRRATTVAIVHKPLSGTDQVWVNIVIDLPLQ
jgi:hypothetical protein